MSCVLRWDWNRNELTLKCGAVTSLSESAYGWPAIVDEDTGEKVIEVVSYDAVTQTCVRCEVDDRGYRRGERLTEQRRLKITPKQS
jgi:hypothetical protein